MTTTDLAVASAMLVYPADCIPAAWGLLRSDDFTEPRSRVVYDSLVYAWAVRGQQEWPGSLAMEVVAITAALRFRCDMPEAFGVVGYVAQAPPCDHPDHVGRREACFEAHCAALAADGALRRTREVVGRWYEELSGITRDGVVLPRLCRDPRSVLAGLLRDIRAALRRTPQAPREEGAVPEVGEW